MRCVLSVIPTQLFQIIFNDFDSNNFNSDRNSHLDSGIKIDFLFM